MRPDFATVFGIRTKTVPLEWRWRASTVKITLLPSSPGANADWSLQYLTTFLIDDALAIDAGCLGFFTAREQARVKHVLLSHSHMDHIASLPIFLENAYGEPSVVTVHASEWVLNCLQSDLFNDRIWPDFIRISRKGEEALLNTAVLTPLMPVHLDGLTITPVPVDHAVPTFGFLVEDATAAIAISGDTGPTEEIWRRANALPNLKAVFLEVAYPNAMANRATKAKHHTPRSFGEEIRKLRLPVPLFAYHIKARYREQVVKELHELGLPSLMIAEADRPYLF
jgi:ribonuclease BN (tRNA processing enzyme)